jgi:hypothetical protein
LGELTREITIAAAVEEVFDYVADPHNAPRYISSITRIVSGPEGSPSVGQRWKAEANFLGQNTSIMLRLAALQPNRGVRFFLEGERPAALSLTLVGSKPVGYTKVLLSLEVPSVPTFLLAGLMGGLLSADLSRLKSQLER